MLLSYGDNLVTGRERPPIDFYGNLSHPTMSVTLASWFSCSSLPRIRFRIFYILPSSV